MHLNYLTNPSQNLQQKMRYFSDYFLYANEFLGRLPDLPFDNPISFVSKIVFQLENNIERSPRYIQNHFTQLLHFYEDFMTKHTKEFEKVKKVYDQYLKSPPGEKKKANWLKNNSNFLTALQNLHSELEKDLFSKVFLSLSNYMVCKHKLPTHKKDIEFYMQILVSLFRLNNHPRKSVDEYIDRIISGNRYNFPFPLEIYAHNKDDSYITKTEEYLNSRDFKKQFEGLKNLMINPKHRKGYFLYAINHVNIDKSFKKTFKVTIDRVTFISPYHPQFKEIKKSVRIDDLENHKDVKIFPRFFGKQKLLAYVELYFENKKNTSIEGAAIVSEEISYLNQYLDVNFKLQEGDFIFTENFKGNDWHSQINMMKYKIVWLDKFKYDSITQTPFELLRQPSTHNQLLYNERVFMKAAANDEVSLFWQYIENLFWFQNENNDKIRERFTRILFKEIDQFTNNLLLSIGHLFYGMQFSKYAEETGLDKGELELLSAELGYKRNIKFPIAKYKTRIKHPFLKRVIGYYLQTTSKAFKPKWEQYFQSLILELQEFRNAELHSGHVNRYAKIKMQELMAPIMNRARWAIIRAWEKNKSVPFNELIASLTKA